MTKELSPSFPSTPPASAARANPAPIDAAISATLTGLSNALSDPSGNRMDGIFRRSKIKKCGEPHFFGYQTEKGFRSDALNPACKFGKPFLALKKLEGAIGLEPQTPTNQRDV